MKQDSRRTCKTCGAVIPVESEFCPVCALCGALDDRQETVELNVEPAPSLSASRFDHYQLLTREGGTPLELGHGAMGVTYKAIDINLRCAVALKVINARFIGDESARRRFVREARAAASVRHPNVASVFHLGMSGDGYFYAMEFVEGETLENLIKRCERLKPKIALEIASQVAAGLTAIHEQNLVHRDVKPANIMVSLKEGGPLTAKIIDLGLAKPVLDAPTGLAVSTPGAFAGTPAFASPEQFAGLAVDIRSDLYSLGVTLWAMLTGQSPFKGTVAEVMYGHLHAPLPLERLQGLPQPIVVLLQALLEKDPRQRLQSPSKFLEMAPNIMGGLDVGLPMNFHSLRRPAGQGSTVPRRAVENLSAYNLYLRGIALMELLDPEANQKAGKFFEEAIEHDPNFALGYVGLACFHLEQEGFRGEKRLLDAAVDSARCAIALDPSEVCAYTTLARAYNRKGWYSQCDEVLRKALELRPNDDTANALAGIRAIARHEFVEAYLLFRKAFVLNPKETWRLYFAAEILFRTDMTDLAEKWMERALDQETSPRLHHLMECYRLMWRRRFADARAGFVQLPPETHLAPRLQTTIYSVSEGLLYCAVAMGNWPAVVETCSSRSKSDPENFWARTYLALGLQRMGRPIEAQENCDEILRRGLERLERPAQPDNPWDVPFYVAWACRSVGREQEAYRYLAQYLKHRTLVHLPLGLDNPILDAFKGDPEFVTILANLKQKLDVARCTIREHEAAALQR